jgi:hypothetical protein
MKKQVTICILAMYCLLSTVAAMSMSSSTSISDNEPYIDESITGTVTIRNDNTFCDMYCQYYNGEWIDVGKIADGKQITKSFTINPPSAPAPYQYNIKVYCVEENIFGICGAEEMYDDNKINVNWQTRPIHFSTSITPKSLSMDSCLTKVETQLVVSNTGDDAVSCEYYGADGSWHNLGSVASGGSQSATIKVTASQARSQKTFSIQVKCGNSYGYSKPDSTTLTVNYQTHPCEAAMEECEDAINDAKDELRSAEQKVQEANNMGAEVTTANNYLQSARSHLSTAEQQFSSSKLSFSNKDCGSSLNQANSGKSSAQQTKTASSNAYAAATQAIREFNEQAGAAKRAIQDARTNIEEARKWITEGKAYLGNAANILQAA